MGRLLFTAPVTSVPTLGTFMDPGVAWSARLWEPGGGVYTNPATTHEDSAQIKKQAEANAGDSGAEAKQRASHCPEPRRLPHLRS